MLVGGLLVIDVYHVDFIHLTPWLSLAVELCDAVGWQICHFNPYGVDAFLKDIAEWQQIRYCPSTTDILVVDVNTSTLSYISQVDNPIVASCQVFLREFQFGGINACSHEFGSILVQTLPSLQVIDKVLLVDFGSALGETKIPTIVQQFTLVIEWLVLTYG